MTEICAKDLALRIEATWPAAALSPCGPFVVPEGQGGGNRVSAARLAALDSDGAAVTRADLDRLRRHQLSLGQDECAIVLPGQAPLDRILADAGYAIRDPVLYLEGPVAEIAAPAPSATCYAVWPPLAVQAEIWAEGGIGPSRLAIMERAKGAKTALLGRDGDRPAGVCFVALHHRIAMLHALEVSTFARRRGLARRMVQAAADWAQTQGADRLGVLVTRENLPARGLYTSLRLQAVGHYHYRVR